MSYPEKPNSGAEGKDTKDESKTNEEKEEPTFTEEDLNWFLSEIMKSPVKFCITVLKLNPYPYQEKFLADLKKRIAVCAGRQVGKTLISASKALWFALSNPKTITIIVSKTRRQSIHMFDKVSSCVEGCDVLKACVVRKTRTLIQFSNGSEIHALPCGPNGDTIRSKTAHLLIVDEANFVPENVITEVAMPMLATTEGTLILVSSPTNKNHYFYRALNSPEWSKYHFKTSDNPTVTQEYLDEMEAIGETGFRREYLGEFVDEENSYFPSQPLAANTHVCTLGGNCNFCKINRAEALPVDGTLYAGYDPGGLSDPAALVIVQRMVNEQAKVTYRVVFSNAYRISKEEKEIAKKNGTLGDVYTRFTNKVADTYKQRMRFRKILVDSTSLGSPIVSHLQELGLPADGLNLTVKTKEEIFLHLKIAMEERRVEIPSDGELLAHLNCIIFERNRTGDYLFSHLRGTHDDLAYALALAVWSAKSGGQKTIIMMNQDPPKYRPWELGIREG